MKSGPKIEVLNSENFIEEPEEESKEQPSLENDTYNYGFNRKMKNFFKDLKVIIFSYTENNSLSRKNSLNLQK